MRKSGFTLIELLAVMGIMVLVTTIAVTGAFGMTRGASFNAAQDSVFNTLQFARQRACIDGKPVLVVFTDETTFCAVQGCGVANDDSSKNKICDNYSSMASVGDKQGKSLAVWNITKGRRSDSVKSVSTHDSGSSNKKPIPGEAKLYYSAPYVQIEPKESIDIESGDLYGFEILPRQVLPKGYKLTVGGKKPTDKSPCIIVFEPNGDGGSANGSDATCAGGKVEVSIFEEILGEDSDSSITIRVENGAISFTKNGKK